MYIEDFISNELKKKMGTYIVEYDYTAKSSDELTVRKGDIITDAIPSEEGWLKGECRGKIGHFPENFVTPINKEKAKNRTFSTIQITENKTDTIRKRPFINNDTSQNGTLFQVRVVYTYLPIHDDEILIKPNDIINVTRLVEEGWYEGILDGKVGLFPSNYVTRIHEDKNKTNQLTKQKPVSNLSVLVKNEASKKNTSPIKARVLYDYKPTADDELTLTTNDIITILDKNLEDEGWWKGEFNGKIGVFPDNYVEEISTSTNLKHPPNTPEIETKYSSQTLSKTKLTNSDSSHNYTNESHHIRKTTSISDEEGHSSRNYYGESNNLDSKEKSNEINKQKTMAAKRPPSSITKKNENLLNKTTGSIDEKTRPQSTDIKNEPKVHTPTPPPFQREPGQLESPRYANRPFSLPNTMNSSLNSSTELLNSSYVNITSLEQLQKDLIKLKSTMNEMNLKFTDQIRDLINELDEEKKARATLQIEIERLQKFIQKSSRVN